MFTSPGFIMGLVALELIYGLFLFAVMSTNRRHRLEALAKAEEAARTVRVEPPLPPRAEVPPPPPPVVEVVKSPPSESQATEVVVAKTETPAEPTIAKKPSKKSRNAEKNRNSKDKKAEPKDLALATTESTAAKSEQSLSAPMTTFPSLGPLIDPLHDSKVKAGDDQVTIQVAAGAHIIDPTRGIADSPRALTAVEGDFTAEVKVLGDFQPGTVPIKGLFFTFQGAGLLIWQDKENYVRFERAMAYTGERLQWVFLESCKDGKASQRPLKVRDGALTLRVERRGNAIVTTYSLDGKTWLKVEHMSTNLPRNVEVGISASNASPRPFPARFTGFVLRPAS